MIIPVEHFSSGGYYYNMLTEPVCRKYGLTHMEFTVLIFLANNLQYDTASDIVKVRRLTKSHVSVSIRGLEEKGLLLKEYKGEDRRSVHLKLTSLAKPVVKDAKEAQKEFFEILLKGFSDEEKDIMQSFVDRMDKNIKNGIKREEEEKNGR